VASRDQVVQSYLDLFENPRYLEVGVSQGLTFHKLKAAEKVAVDPQFQIPAEDRQSHAKYHEMTSDHYFDMAAKTRPLFDVIYLDGLHTLEQTLRDLMNALDFLRHDGVIVIDDVVPESYHSSLPDFREFTAVREAVGDTSRSWMGDVFRLVFFVQSFLPRFDYATTSDNHGQLVMWRGSRSPALFQARRVEDIGKMEFRSLIMQMSALNHLSNAEIVRRVRERDAS
jgi:hypothetical protein